MEPAKYTSSPTLNLVVESPSEVIMPEATGCPISGFGVYLAQRPDTIIESQIVTPIEDDLEAAYAVVFRDTDTSSWQPREGRYSRNIRWIYGSC